MNMLRKKVYRVLYEILNCLSVRWDWRWINDSKIFFGTALVILSVGESKKGQAAERQWSEEIRSKLSPDTSPVSTAIHRKPED